MNPSQKPKDNPIRGASYVLEGFALLGRPGIRPYVVAPLLINIVLFGGALWWGWSQLSQLSAVVESWLPSWLSFLSTLLVPLFFVVAVMFVQFAFVLIGNFIAAPFNGPLAEAVERNLRAEPRNRTQNNSSPVFSLVVRDLHRTVASEMRKLVYFLPRALAIGVLHWVPLLNLIAPLLWFMFSAWMLAISYADFPMGNHKLGFREQRAELSRWRLTSLGFGGFVAFVVLIPVINLFVIPASVAGATKLWVERIAPYRSH